MNAVAITGYVLTGAYVMSMVYISLFCLFQLHLLWKYLQKGSMPEPVKSHTMDGDNFPAVTIQLPLFNERYVAGRLIDNMVKMDYPRHKLQIQVLDDSTDETLDITKQKVKQYKDEGFDIELHHRTNRTGFKAGALKQAQDTARGEFIAIFDADFMPEHDFLRRTLPYFNKPDTGVVQTRWTHLNQSYSLLTELQAFQLNVHFITEQTGRYKGGYFLQFNGTAGVWRKSCIDDSGGWQPDTLTEDLDLSYRAQMKGWKIIYLEDVESPAELPVEINGLKSQQYRWMKGGAETARKILPKLWSSKAGLSVKIHGTYHMLVGTLFPVVFAFGLLSLALLWFKEQFMAVSGILSWFMGGMAIVGSVYYTANVLRAWPEQNRLWMHLKFLVLFPVFISVSMALSLHNAVAVLDGYLGRKTDFVRTPKYGITNRKNRPTRRTYFSGKMDLIAVCELALGLTFAAASVAGILYGNNQFMSIHVMLTAGYFTLFGYALKSKLS